jgi:hypothetical protein
MLDARLRGYDETLRIRTENALKVFLANLMNSVCRMM